MKKYRSSEQTGQQEETQYSAVITKTEEEDITEEEQEQQDENNENCSPAKQAHYMWSYQESVKLIKLVKTYFSLLEDKRVKKKTIWKKIWQEMDLDKAVTPEQVMKKWKNMQYYYQKYINCRKMPNNRMREPPHFYELHSFLGTDTKKPKFKVKSETSFTGNGRLVFSDEEDCIGESSFSSAGMDSDEEDGAVAAEWNDPSTNPSSTQKRIIVISRNSAKSDDEDQSKERLKRQLELEGLSVAKRAKKDEDASGKFKSIWTHRKCIELINLMKTYRVLLEDRRIKRKHVFSKVLEEMESPSEDLTPERIEKKWKNMLYMYNKYMLNVQTHGYRGQRLPPYFKEIREFMLDSNDASLMESDLHNVKESLDDAPIYDQPDADGQDDDMDLGDEGSEIESRPPTPCPDKISRREPSSLEESLNALVELEKRKFEFLKLESERKHKFKLDFLAVLNKRTESLERLESKVDRLLKRKDRS